MRSCPDTDIDPKFIQILNVIIYSTDSSNNINPVSKIKHEKILILNKKRILLTYSLFIQENILSQN